MKRISRNALAFAALLAMPAMALAGPLELVTPDPDPATNVANINAALANVDVGGTIGFAVGHYPINATIIVNKEVTIVGPKADQDPRPSAGSTRTLNSDTPGPATEAIIDGQGSIGTLFTITASNVTVNGLEFRDATSDMLQIPSSSNLSNVTVKYCIIHTATGDEGVQLRDTTNTIIEYNYFKDIAQDGANICCGGNGFIRYNEFENVNSVNGTIFVYDTGGSVEIIGNYIHGSGSANGIHPRNFGAGSSLVIQDNIIDSNAWNASTRGQDNNAIFLYKTVESAALSSITVTGNTISNNSALVNASQGNGIYIFHDSGASTSHTIDVSGNTFDGNDGYGVKVELENAADTALLAGITVNDNVIVNNGDGGLNNLTAANIDATVNWWGSASGPSGGSGATGAGQAISADVTFSPWHYFVGTSAPADTSSSAVNVAISASDNDRYTLHSVDFPVSSLSGVGTVEIAPPLDRLGAENSVEITLTGAAIVSGQATVTIEYDPVTDIKQTDGTPEVDENLMQLYVYNTGTTSWDLIAGSTVDTGNNTVSGQVSGFSQFAAFANPSANVDEWMMLED